MLVAALFDIHGNLPALRAVLAEVAALQPRLLVIGGDVVAGPMPAETLDAIFDAGILMRWVMGEADREVVAAEGASEATAAALATEGDAPAAAAAWAAARLRPEQLQLVATFQPTVLTGGTLFCHGSPRSDTETLSPATEHGRLAAACAGVRQRLVVCGRSHRQFRRAVNGCEVVGAGAVGVPGDGDGTASWVLLRDGVPELRRTAYPAAAAQIELRGTGMPGLEALLPAPPAPGAA